MGLSLEWDGHRLDLEKRTHVMGVLNVTPDSFSDGGRYFDWKKAVERGLEMAREGADIIDVGGESTRPYSDGITIDEELERIIPVIQALAREITIPISIDTYKSEVAREAIGSGASIINDISALRFDPLLASIASKAGVPVVLMHMQGTPRDMQVNPTYEDLIHEILAFLDEAAARAMAAGISEKRIVIDPGIGFGKTFDDNLMVIRELSRFKALPYPLLLGPSNKAFIGHILDREPHERDTGTMAAVAACVMNGAHMVRVHNVSKTVETIKIIDAVRRGKADE